MQRGRANQVRGVDVGSQFKQRIDRFPRAEHGRDVKRSLAGFGPRLDVGSRPDQQADVVARAHRRRVQRRRADLARGVDLGARFEQPDHSVGRPLPSHHVQRSPAKKPAALRDIGPLRHACPGLIDGHDPAEALPAVASSGRGRRGRSVPSMPASLKSHRRHDGKRHRRRHSRPPLRQSTHDAVSFADLPFSQYILDR